MTDLIRWGERLFLIPLSLAVILRLAPELGEHPHFVLFLVSELVGVALLLLQRRGETTTAFYPILIAFVGTGVALLVVPTGQRLISDQASLALILAGSAIALAAKLFLGRSFGVVPANRGVKAAGVYRFVRHPMYAGYMINQLGFLLVFFSLHNVVIYAVAWTTLWLRAVEEEKILCRDPAYQRYATQVRFRLIPGVA
ncbi:MAG: isoprenylcysteine carboxylmethyltransferase family protein [Novosphingobium sp.]|nr:isoprenylcysteine carboxylmethyltransferase family protein [Novosphingobium sp.]